MGAFQTLASEIHTEIFCKAVNIPQALARIGPYFFHNTKAKAEAITLQDKWANPNVTLRLF